MGVVLVMRIGKIIFSFTKLFYNEVMAGNVKIDMPKGYMQKVQQAIDLLDEYLLGTVIIAR